MKDSDNARQEHARNSLDAVRNHWQVQEWLRDANDRFHLRQARTAGASRTWRLRLWATAASVALIVVTLSALNYRQFVAERYETRVGEQRDVVLSDGSKITLNTNTAVAVRYSRQRRYVVLERGEALFSVAHNASRPFDVAAAGTLTRALGTQFNVDVRSRKVTVSVIEGAVRVSMNELRDQVTSDVATAAALSKGEALELQPKEQILHQGKADISRIDAWQTRHLEFSDTPLADAVEEFNRYTVTRIVIGTPALAAVRISGVFRIGDTDGFLYSLREVLGVEAHESAREMVLMRSGT
jgi:transmembrane sensor